MIRRAAEPTAGIIDSQSVRAADTVHHDTRGYDTLRTTLKIVRKPADQRGFVAHPRRWVVERTLAWLTAHRRLARDHETHPTTSEATIRWAAIAGMLGRLTRNGPATRRQRRTFTAPA